MRFVLLNLSSFQPLQHKIWGRAQKKCAQHKKTVLGTEKLCSAQKNCARYRNFCARYRNFCAQWYGWKSSSYQLRTKPYHLVPKPYHLVPTPYQLRTSSYQTVPTPYQRDFRSSSHSDEGLASGFEFPGSRVFRSTVPPDFQLNCCLFNRVVGVMIEKLPSTAK